MFKVVPEPQRDGLLLLLLWFGTGGKLPSFDDFILAFGATPLPLGKVVWPAGSDDEDEFIAGAATDVWCIGPVADGGRGVAEYGVAVAVDDPW